MSASRASARKSWTGSESGARSGELSRRLLAAAEAQHGARPEGAQARPYRDFLITTLPKGWTADAPHMALIGEHLDAVDRGEIDRLAIHMPPRHAKTETITVRYPVRCLSQRPADNVLLTGYNERFSRRLGRKSRNIAVQMSASGLIELDPEKQAADEWATRQGGVLMTRGVGSPPTGVGFRRIVIDDPIRRRADAESDTYRENVWDWYTDDLYTRLEPGGAIILVMCMTGDTLVTMADSSHKPLKDIRAGDSIATYDDGVITTSHVEKWKNQGPDVVFEIRMKSGIIVKANERHPFLVEQGGKLEWVRVRNLRPGDKIVCGGKRGSGANGKASLVPLRDVISLQSAGASVHLTTTNGYGRAATDRHPSTLNPVEKPAYDTDTVSRRQNTTHFSPHNGANVQSVALMPQAAPQPTGPRSCALTTTTKQGRCEDCCVTPATSPLVTAKQKKSCCQPLDTFVVGSDEIVEIVAAGTEDVFDIQVARTANFLANGLVSHNTLWHEDDIGARAIASEPNRWTILKLPALAEEADPLGRAPGAALWPERYNAEDLERIHGVMSGKGEERSWLALFQQRPTPREGSFFRVGRVGFVDAAPAGLRVVRRWDMAATEGGGAYTVGVKMGTPKDRLHPDFGRYYVLDVVRGQWSTDRRDARIRLTAEADGRAVPVGGPQDPGAAGVDAAAAFVRNLAGFSASTDRVSGSKEARADPYSSQFNAGNVFLVRAAWNSEFVNEHRGFPDGKYKDQVDAAADAFADLTRAPAEAPSYTPAFGAVKRR